GDRRAAGDPPDSTAGDHGGGAGTRSCDSRGDPRVTALPIVGEHGAGGDTLRDEPRLGLAPAGTAPRSPLPSVVVRYAALADVPSLEALMSPYFSTGDVLPRRHLYLFLQP